MSRPSLLESIGGDPVRGWIRIKAAPPVTWWWRLFGWRLEVPLIRLQSLWVRWRHGKEAELEFLSQRVLGVPWRVAGPAFEAIGEAARASMLTADEAARALESFPGFRVPKPDDGAGQL